MGVFNGAIVVAVVVTEPEILEMARFLLCTNVRR
jgi:hypothetical protein